MQLPEGGEKSSNYHQNLLSQVEELLSKLSLKN